MKYPVSIGQFILMEIGNFEMVWSYISNHRVDNAISHAAASNRDYGIVKNLSYLVPAQSPFGIAKQIGVSSQKSHAMPKRSGEFYQILIIRIKKPDTLGIFIFNISGEFVG